MAAAGLDRTDPRRGLLAAELDIARFANSLPVLSAVAWIHPGGRRAGADANGKVNLGAVAPRFLLLFVISTPAWWLFELINLRTANWEYLGRELFSPLQFNLLCTISFSIVVPAVFETADLMRSFRWIDRFRSGPRVSATRGVFVGLFVIGLTMPAAMLIWPKVFYPFAWTSLVFILEPITYWTGRPYFLKQLRTGDWRTVISLSLGALVCGLFWELWNYYSFPKWIYHVPALGFLRIFEMPLLGYGGYVPFALELYALKNFLWPAGPRLEN